MASLERILSSDEFAQSPQLCRFLRHTVENRLAGNTEQLKESSIGVTVFRRGVDYDPKSDPIVRVQARRLRARLDSYYSRKGADDALRIVLHKGGYAPLFESPEAPEALEPSQLVPPPAPPLKKSRWMFAAVAAIVTLVGAGLAYRLATPEALTSRFWSSIFQEGRSTLIVPSDTGLAMLQDLVHKPVPLHDYVSGDYRARYEGDNKLGSVAWTFGERRYTPMADLDFVANLARRPEAARARTLTRFARDVRVEDTKGTNLILLGPKHMNPWVELFEKETTFRLDHDEAASSYHLLNTKPAAGDVQDAVISSSDVRDQVYRIVNFHRSREGTSVLIVMGTSVAGTEAAADFVLDNAKLLPILQKAEQNGRIRSFDLLLRGRNLAGAAPRASVVGFHIAE